MQHSHSNSKEINICEDLLNAYKNVISFGLSLNKYTWNNLEIIKETIKQNKTLATFTSNLAHTSLLSCKQINSLCHGYIRNLTSISLYSINNVIKTCCDYFSNQLMHKIMLSFQSFIFEIGFKYHNSHLEWSIRLVCGPLSHTLKIRRIELSYTLIFYHLNYKRICQTIDLDYKKNQIVTKTLRIHYEINNLNLLNYKWNLHELNLFDNINDVLHAYKSINNNIINLNSNIITRKTYSYIWNLCDKEIDNNFTNHKLNSTISPIFELNGFKWILQLVAKKQKLTLSLIPTFLHKETSYIVIKYRFYIEDKLKLNNIRSSVEFVKLYKSSIGNIHGDYLVSWSPDELQSINCLNNLKITVFITIINVYKHSNDTMITSNYITEKKQEIISRKPVIYTWYIPFVSNTKLDDLFNGYIREISNIYYIENMIIKLCVDYFQSGDIIDEIKKAKQDQSFKSNKFIVNGIKMMLHFIPIRRMDSISMLQLHILSIPTDIQITLLCEIEINEVDIKFAKILLLKNHKAYFDILPVKCGMKNTDFIHTKSLTIKVKIQIIDMFNQFGDVIQLQNKPLIQNFYSNLTRYHTWKIDDKQVIQQVKDLQSNSIISPMFNMLGFKWYISLEKSRRTDGIIMSLKVVSLPPNVGTVYFEGDLILKETNTSYSRIVTMDSYTDGWSWPDTLLKRNEILNESSLTFEIVFHLISIQNDSEEIITDKFIRNMRELQKLNSNLISTSPRQFSWIISDVNTIKMLKTANQIKKIVSPIFELYSSLKWFLTLEWTAYDNITLRLFMLSNKVDVSVKYKIIFEQVNDEKIAFKHFDNYDYNYSWDISSNHLDTIRHLHKLTFSVFITLIDVYEDYSILTAQYINHYKHKKQIQYINNNETYIWKIPFVETEKLNHVCCGYIRTNMTKYVENIDNTIISLCIYYLTDDNLIKTQSFDSNVFILHGFKWNMNICRRDGRLYIQLVSLPPNIISIATVCQIKITELNSIQTYAHIFKQYNNDLSVYPTGDFENQNSLTIQFTLTVIEVLDEDDNLCENYSLLQTPLIKPNIDTFEWKITDKELINKDKIFSPIFNMYGLKWNIQFLPLGYKYNKATKMSLQVLGLPFDIKDMYTKCQLMLKETNTIYNACHNFSTNNIYWTSNTLPLANISKLTQLTFVVSVSIIDMFDHEYNSITDKYCNMMNLHVQKSQIALIKPNEEHLYRWKISDKQIMQNIKTPEKAVNILSPMFSIESFKWCLRLHKAANDDNIEIQIKLCCLSSNILTIVLKHTLSLEELNKHQTQIKKFCNNSYDWSVCKIKDIKHINELTFNVSMLLIDVHEKEKEKEEKSLETCLDINDKNQLENSYVWNIFSIEQSKIKCLCNGYLKQKFNKKYIENTIVNLCVNYFSYDVINHMKHSQPDEQFQSDMFVSNGFKWIITLWPNGKKSNPGYFDANLKLISLSPNITKIYAIYSVLIPEIDSMYQDTICIEFDDFIPGFSISDNKTKFKERNDINKLTVHIKIRIIDIFDKNGICINNKYALINNPKIYNNAFEKFEWKISNKKILSNIQNAKNGQLFLSPIFNICSINFYLEFYPYGFDEDDYDSGCLYLTIASMPPNISRVYFKYKLILKETNTKHNDITFMDNKDESVGWGSDQITIAQINNLKQFTFDFQILLIDIYHKNGNKITDKYIKNKTETFKQLYRYKTETKELIISNPKIFTLPNGECFETKVFEMLNFKWKVEIFPNGIGKDCIDSANIYFYLISLPPNINELHISYKIHLYETNTWWSESVTFTHKEIPLCGCSLRKYKLNNIKLLTLKLDITVIDIFDNNDNYIHNLPIQKPTSKIETPFISEEHSFTWNVPNDLMESMKIATNKSQFLSKLFIFDDFEWSIVVVPNGIDLKTKGMVKIKLKLESLGEEIGGVSCKFLLLFKEAKTKYTNYLHFNKNNLSLLADENCVLNTVFIKKYKTFIMDVKIKIIDIYDKNGNIMTSKYFSLVCSINDKNNRMDKLKLWLKNKVKLEKYFDTFVSNGIDDIFKVKVLKMKDLNKIGIEYIDDCINILHQIEILNQQIME